MTTAAGPAVALPPAPRQTARRFSPDVWLVSLCTLVFAANTLWRIFALPMWGDEVRTWRDSVNKPYGLILTWQHNRDHAPLGHLLAKVSADVFRTDAPWAMRLPSWLFGVACVPLGYRLGRVVWGRRAGWWVAIFLTVDGTVASQAQYARMYTMFMAFSLAALTAAVLAIRRRHGRRWTQALAIGGTLGGALWSHYAATAWVISLLVTGVAMLAFRRSRGRGLTVLAGVGVALLTAVPGLVKLGRMAHMEKLPYTKSRDTAQQFWFAMANLTGGQALAVVLTLTAWVGLFLVLRRRRWPGVLLFVTLLVVFANLLVAARYRQIEGARYLLGFLPAAWTGIAVVGDVLWRDRRAWVGYAAAALFTAGTVFQFQRALLPPEHPQAVPLRHAAAAMRALGYRPEDGVVCTPAEPVQLPLIYYHIAGDTRLESRLLGAMRRGDPGPHTLGRDQPKVLWVLAVAPCRPKQRHTLADGLALAQTAARCYGQTLSPERLTTRWEQRRLCVVRLTTGSIDVWSAEGKPR